MARSALGRAAEAGRDGLVLRYESDPGQHAPGAVVEVGVDHRTADVTLTVHNGPCAGRVPASDGGGHGLLGMRERVRHCGGDLRAGPTDAGGWQVIARLPRADREPV